jgi:SAM-dependent methyltransferase
MKVDNKVDNNDAQLWNAEYEGRLTKRWLDFVDCPKRMKVEGPFLLNLLGSKSAKILDAAMGTGCESVYLTKLRYNVTGNELRSNFRKVSREYAKREGVNFRITGFDWRTLANDFNDEVFDLVLVTGNSFCSLQDAQDRLKAADNFRKVCAPGGALVIDQRNFDYILNNREEILAGNFRYRAEVIYCGQKVRGRPVAIESDQVRFVYEDAIDNSVLGYLDMYPFIEGEIVNLFSRTGFKQVEIYSDLVPGYCQNADFYTYVFR